MGGPLLVTSHFFIGVDTYSQNPIHLLSEEADFLVRTKRNQRSAKMSERASSVSGLCAMEDSLLSSLRQACSYYGALAAELDTANPNRDTADEWILRKSVSLAKLEIDRLVLALVKHRREHGC